MWPFLRTSRLFTMYWECVIDLSSKYGRSLVGPMQCYTIPIRLLKNSTWAVEIKGDNTYSWRKWHKVNSISNILNIHQIGDGQSTCHLWLSHWSSCYVSWVVGRANDRVWPPAWTEDLVASQASPCIDVVPCSRVFPLDQPMTVVLELMVKSWSEIKVLSTPGTG